jgi:hypothetical protein
MSPDLSELPPADPRQLDLWGVAHATAGRPAKLMGEDALLFAECYRLGIQIAAIIVAMDVVCGIHLSRFAAWAACRRLDLPRRHGSNAERQERRHHNCPDRRGRRGTTAECAAPAARRRHTRRASEGYALGRGRTLSRPCRARAHSQRRIRVGMNRTTERQVSRQFPNAA